MTVAYVDRYIDAYDDPYGVLVHQTSYRSFAADHGIDNRSSDRSIDSVRAAATGASIGADRTIATRRSSVVVQSRMVPS